MTHTILIISVYDFGKQYCINNLYFLLFKYTYDNMRYEQNSYTFIWIFIYQLSFFNTRMYIITVF